MRQGRTNRLTGYHIPTPGRVVLAASQDNPAVRTEGGVIDTTVMPREAQHAPPRRHIPKLSVLVHVTGQDRFAVGTEGHGIDGAVMQERRAELFSRVGVPKTCGTVPACR